jgi:hypothetical protein
MSPSVVGLYDHRSTLLLLWMQNELAWNAVAMSNGCVKDDDGSDWTACEHFPFVCATHGVTTSFVRSVSTTRPSIFPKAYPSVAFSRSLRAIAVELQRKFPETVSDRGAMSLLRLAVVHRFRSPPPKNHHTLYSDRRQQVDRHFCRQLRCRDRRAVRSAYRSH